MAAIACPVVKVEQLVPHPGADKLDLLELSNAVRVVTGKHYTEGQLGIYIPPGVVLPGWMADDMWLYGTNKAMSTPFVVRELTLQGIKSPGLFCGQSYRKDNSDSRSIERFQKLKDEGGRVVSDDVLIWPGWRDWWQIGDDVSTWLGIRP